MRARVRLVLVASTVMASSFLVAPAEAAVTWQSGVRTSSVPTGALGFPVPGAGNGRAWTWSFRNWDNHCASSDSSNGLESSAYVIFNGDDVWVKDECADGRGAVLRVQDANNYRNQWICRNSHGNNTWAKCSFDWPETSKVVIAGSVTSSGSVHWDDGASVIVGGKN